jgi:hypothetical protein
MGFKAPPQKKNQNIAVFWKQNFQDAESVTHITINLEHYRSTKVAELSIHSIH